MSKENAIVKEKNITDVVFNKVMGFAESGELVLPRGYSEGNALKAAWLALQSVENRDGDKALSYCTPASISNALLDMVVQGLSPAKNQCYFVMYKNELVLQRSYMGTVAAAKRFSDVEDVFTNVIYEGDVLKFTIDPKTGIRSIVKHEQSFENIDVTKIKGAYAVVVRQNADNYTEFMTMDQIRRAWEQGPTKGNSPAHKKFPEEMAKKTVINRACKMFVNTSDDSAILAEAFRRTTDNEYRKNEDAAVEVIDVDENEIKEVKDAAQEAVFGSEAVENEKVEDVPEETTKDEQGDSQEPEQISMEGGSDE